MDILVIGSGGREHTLTWKLAQSKLVDKIYAVPGNPGMEKIAQCIPGSIEDNEFLVKVAQEKKVDLVVIGPEVPLTMELLMIWLKWELLLLDHKKLLLN